MRLFNLTLALSVISLFLYGIKSYAQEAPLLKTDAFIVTKASGWCAKNAQVTASAVKSANNSGLNTLASELKFVFEFECPVAQSITIDVVETGAIQRYIISEKSNWKISQGPQLSTRVDEIKSEPEKAFLNSWRPDSDYSESRYFNCGTYSERRSAHFVKSWKTPSSQKAFNDAWHYSAKLFDLDARYDQTLRQIDKEKRQLQSTIERDDRRRAARGGLFRIKGNRSQEAKASIERLQALGENDPALQLVIEIAFDRMNALDTLEKELAAEIDLTPQDDTGLSNASLGRANLKTLKSCIGWEPTNSKVKSFMPDIINQHQESVFNKLYDKYDQVMRDRTPMARSNILAQINNVDNVASLEYFWSAYPDYVGEYYSSDSELMQIYDVKMAALKVKEKQRQVEAERQRVLDEQRAIQAKIAKLEKEKEQIKFRRTSYMDFLGRFKGWGIADENRKIDFLDVDSFIVLYNQNAEGAKVQTTMECLRRGMPSLVFKSTISPEFTDNYGWTERNSRVYVDGRSITFFPREISISEEGTTRYVNTLRFNMNEPNGIKASFQETSATNNPLGELVNGLMSMSMTLLPNELSTGVYNLEDAAEANEIKVYTDMRTPQGRKKVKILHLENDVLKRMLSVCEIEF